MRALAAMSRSPQCAEGEMTMALAAERRGSRDKRTISLLARRADAPAQPQRCRACSHRAKARRKGMLEVEIHG